jgi:serine/threonine protein kinase
MERFRIGPQIGCGAFGKVFLSVREKSGDIVVIKAMSKVAILLAHQESQLIAESGTVASLSHPFIVKYLSSFQDKRHLFLVLEVFLNCFSPLIGGWELNMYSMTVDEETLCKSYVQFLSRGDLYALIRESEAGALPRAAATFYAAQMACVIGYLHDQNFIYRDLKPENIGETGRGSAFEGVTETRRKVLLVP